MIALTNVTNLREEPESVIKWDKHGNTILDPDKNHYLNRQCKRTMFCKLEAVKYCCKAPHLHMFVRILGLLVRS